MWNRPGLSAPGLTGPSQLSELFSSPQAQALAQQSPYPLGQYAPKPLLHLPPICLPHCCPHDLLRQSYDPIFPCIQSVTASASPVGDAGWTQVFHCRGFCFSSLAHPPPQHLHTGHTAGPVGSPTPHPVPGWWFSAPGEHFLEISL